MANYSVGGFLAALRKANGLTQKELAEKLNVSDKAVSRWERDECAPDLSVIPVLAELYGVTCDEILRGQRAAPDAQPKAQVEEKSKKRLEYMLEKLKADYKIRSLISALLGTVGLLVVLLLNFAFQKATAGLFVGCIFLVAAAVCQIIFGIRLRASVSAEEFDEERLEKFRRSILKLDEIIYSGLAMLLAVILPFAFVGDSHWGLAANSWLLLCVIFVAVVGVACLIVCRWINVRKGISAGIDWNRPMNRLRLRCGLSLLVALGILLGGQCVLGAILNSNAFCQRYATEFTEKEDFLAYIQQPLDPEGDALTASEEEYCYVDAEGNWYYSFQDSVVFEDGTVWDFSWNNHSVVRILPGTGSDGACKAYTMTSQQVGELNGVISDVLAWYLLVYPVAMGIVVAVYLVKKRRITEK